LFSGSAGEGFEGCSYSSNLQVLHSQDLPSRYPPPPPPISLPLYPFPYPSLHLPTVLQTRQGPFIALPPFHLPSAFYFLLSVSVFY
jgi:hypothetical protein